ncbi:Protein of unknown function [Micromonospora pattaloongensis]|uniref:DUF2752 domain-containing protein n=1 Tax=Micromonospora pattaloongensis TaxID=405436 RepID=A0A1H3Q4T3_9ACTN|nr:DUF2752 domain-containing protein [Micromonospora pattaloongensis]SDZ08181.1 Protein of unknown function [Micromonospora pattaloongensis]
MTAPPVAGGRIGGAGLRLALPPVVAVGAAIWFRAFPAGSFPYPPCPLYALTGLYCPGCGSTRVCHALAAGDVPGAFRQNPLVVVTLAALAALWVRAVVRAGRPPAARAARPRLIAGVAAAVVLFGVLRNLPGLELLAPR